MVAQCRRCLACLEPLLGLHHWVAEDSAHMGPGLLAACGAGFFRSTCKLSPCCDGGSGHLCLLASWPLSLVQVWDSEQGWPLPPPREHSSTSPTHTVAFCFLGDTSIRRCVPVTNLLQAGQLSQGSLGRWVGKADTLGSAGKPVSWQRWWLGLQEPSQDTKQTPDQADLGTGPSSAAG